jgi:hypothetical protein
MKFQSFADFDRYRTETDAAADHVIKRIIDTDAKASINRIFTRLTYNNSFETAVLPPALRSFLQEVSTLPQWYDAEKARIGEAVFSKYGVEICFVLICRSLPECYLCWRGAKALFETGRLMFTQQEDISRVTRRFAGTLQFIVNVMTEGSTAPHGKGIVTAQKVRLTHAYVRHLLYQQGWDAASLGEPINQEDMAMTLTTFSSSIIEGLELLNITLLKLHTMVQ